MAKTGLVLEGGGQRGIYTAGVLDVFMDNDIEVDGVIGCRREPYMDSPMWRDREGATCVTI